MEYLGNPWNVDARLRSAEDPLAGRFASHTVSECVEATGRSTLRAS